MSKKSIIAIMILLISVGILSLYSTFAYDEEVIKLGDSNADYNIIYSLKETSSKEISIAPNEEKFIDISLTNPYESTVRYGMYYYMIEPTNIVDGLNITLAEDSIDLVENYIKPNQTRSVSIKVSNHSNQDAKVLIGALVGFENGEISELAKNGEILIK